MAEALFSWQQDRGSAQVPVVSRGLAAPTGQPAHPLAQQVCALRGTPVNAQWRSAPVQSADMAAAKLVLVMEHAHKHEVLARFPTAGGKTFLLGHWEGGEIADPIGRDLDFFIRTYDLIATGVASWIPRLKLAGLLA